MIGRKKENVQISSKILSGKKSVSGHITPKGWAYQDYATYSFFVYQELTNVGATDDLYKTLNTFDGLDKLVFDLQSCFRNDFSVNDNVEIDVKFKKIKLYII